MKIGSHTALSNSHEIGRTQRAISRALERLSTGKRVNSPRDGVVDYVSALRLDSQIRGISQITSGLNRALGLTSVADSAISSQIDLVQRMREIAIEGASGPLDTTTRKSLNSELLSLLEEFDRITQSTDFDGQKLLDGSFTTTTLLAGLGDQTIDISFNSLLSNEAFEKTIGTGSFDIVSEVVLGGSPGEMNVTDLNGDGNLDIAYEESASGAFFVQLGNGDGTFGSIKSFSMTNLDRVALGDFDEDGIVDVIAVAAGDDVFSFRQGNGDGSFQSGTTFFAGDNPSTLEIADINNDGHLDIAHRVVGSDAVGIHLGNGDGTFEDIQTFETGITPVGLTLGDFNNDGNLDVALSDRGDDNLEILIGNGDGSFQERVTYDAGNSPAGPGAGDVNQDGILDILAFDSVDDVLNVYIGNGDGTFQERVTYSAGDQPTSAARLGDVNGDGIPDVMGTLGVDDSISLMLGNGDGSFGAALIVGNGEYPGNLVQADFNQDGAIDFTANIDRLGTDIIRFYLNKTTEVSALSDLNVSSEENAEELIKILDSTIEGLLSERTNIGNKHNAIETALSSNLVQQESLVGAKSLIEDTDFIIETAELVRNQVLQQAQIAVASQANTQLQVVLGLLQF